MRLQRIPTFHDNPLSAPVAGTFPPAPDAKIAMGWMHTARFLTTAAQLHHLPPIDVPEIAFVGPLQRRQIHLHQHPHAAKAAGLCLQKTRAHAAHQPVLPGQAGA
jgi:hypothetical protein